MGRLQTFLFILLVFLGAAHPAAAQDLITGTSEAILQPELPRRLLFTLEARSDAGNLTEARLVFRPTGSSVRTSEPVSFEPTPSVELEYEWQMQLNHFPPGAKIEYYWELADDAGNQWETPVQEVVALDPRFEWQTVEDEELAIHWYDGDQAWGQQMFDTGKAALAQLEEELGTDIKRQVRLVAYDSGDAFRGAFPPQQDWIGGSAFPDLGVTVQIIAAGDEEWMRTVIFHELSHLVFHQAMEGALATAPAWLEEGLAMYNEPESRDSEERVREAAETGELLPFSGVQGNFGADGRTVGIAYAQSEMMVTYLIEDCGESGFQAFIQNLVDDMSVDNALEAACGYDSETLYNSWRATLPNAPVAGGESPSVPAQPAPVTTGAPRLLIAFMGVMFCFMSLLGVAILYVVGRLLRPRKGIT